MIARLVLFAPGFALSEYLGGKIKENTILKSIIFAITIVAWQYIIGVRYNFIEMIIYYVVCKFLLIILYNKLGKGGKYIG